MEPGGWDNATFRLGRHLAVRLPRARAYVPQVEKQYAWLPRLAPALPLRVPQPLAMGAPAERYPWPWLVTTWIEGEPATRRDARDLDEWAKALAGFLRALHRIDATGGPVPGLHNFHRGGALGIYDAEARRAIEALRPRIDARRAARMWDGALQTTWHGEPVWVHGDMTSGNLLVADGRLRGVIDFGLTGIGDPACDLAIAWTFLERRSRAVFREALALDADTWTRGRGWALWKAAIVAAGVVKSSVDETRSCWRTLDEVLRPAP